MALLRQFGRCAVVVLLSFGWTSATHAMESPFSLQFGTAWYPEQWPEQRWSRDLDLMRAAHINVVRIAEFSWSSLEPSEGRYQFGWLDRAIAKAAAHHIKVVIGTPTAAPPVWLTQEYPNVLRINEDGSREEHGNRLQYSFASERYRKFARDIAARLAVRYGHNPDVVGWQIDNEISPVSYDDVAKAQFHAWLQARYGTIAALNARWATAYWSQTYNSFDQVPLHPTGQNPGLLLDFKRFVSDTWTSYVRNQADVIRAHARPDQFVTTNSMHWNARYDHFQLHRILDLAAWDNYIPDGRYDWADNALLHDAVRGYKQKNFWVMETQAGFVNYGKVNRSLDPGQMCEMAWQAVGRGADALLYWQWRSALNGQEQYYGTLVGPDGEPVPAYGEAQKIGAEFAKASAALAKTGPRAEVALIQSYESRWALAFQPHNQNFDAEKEFAAFYRPLLRSAQTLDIVSPDVDLDRYKLVVAPALNVVTQEQAGHLATYVRRGGHLILGPRSGMKNEDNALWPSRQPGPLRGLLGGHVEQFYALEAPVSVEGATGNAEASIWAETLAADAADVQAPMHYSRNSGWLSERPAVLTRRVGKGTVTYLGAWLDDAAMRKFLAAAAAEAAVRPVLAVPDDVEVCERLGRNKRVLILINHGEETRVIRLPRVMKDVLHGNGMKRSVTLDPHDVAVLLGKGKIAP